ncbi:MAG: class F sortase [Clostridia bacterium]|nr:class F sortase [Clostridia bacterium]
MEKNDRKERRKKRRRRNRIFNICLYVLSACLILFGVYIILREFTWVFNHSSAEAPDATFPPITTEAAYTAAPDQTEKATHAPGTTEPPDPGPTPRPEPGKKPVSISFVDYDVNVAIVPIGVDDEGNMHDVPSAEIAGWLETGACPNQEGNCIIGGHIRYHGKLGLFSVLRDKLKPGDRVIVKMEDGSYAFYTVLSVNEYPYDDIPSSVMSQTGEKRLTLITCKGDYDYLIHTSRTRVVVVCRPVTASDQTAVD